MSAALVERRRVRDHLIRALRAVRHATLPGLTDEQRARRAAALGALGDYIAAGRFPCNRAAPHRTPVFVDGDGARCAMAALIGATGDDALVDRIARGHNLARVRDLAGDADLGAWLDRHGLTLAEAARIQPAYSAHLEHHWQPTASVVASVAAGASTDAGAQVVVAPGLRVGVRREARGSTDHGSSIYGSLALTVEYARDVVIAVGGAHRLGLVLQWEPHGNSSDVQWYLLGGPLALIDGDGAPGGGWGGQFGAGFSFRRREVPLLFELTGQGVGQTGGAALRLALTVGAVW
jgi:hypothetical protein